MSEALPPPGTLADRLGTLDPLVRSEEEPPAGRPYLRVLVGDDAPRGAVDLEVEPFLADALRNRGLPARFRARPVDVASRMPPGEPLLTLQDDGPRRPIAVRLESGEVVLGFDPDRALARSLAEDDRGTPSRPVGGRWTPSRSRLLLDRLLRHREAPGLGTDTDALVVSLSLLLEEAVTDDRPLAAPTPYWPDGARFAVALAHEVDGPGVQRVDILRGIEVELGLRSTWFAEPSVLDKDPAPFTLLEQEGAEVGLLDPRACPRELPVPRFGALPAELGYRCPPALRSGSTLRAAGERFAYVCAQPARAAGTVFPFRVGGAVRLPVALETDYELKGRGASATGAFDSWTRGLDRVRRAGGLAVLITRPDDHLTGGDLGYRRALEDVLEELDGEPEAWLCTAGEAARWWASGRRLG